ncbi:1208_t:CDS:2, partial [Racocetra fulgida]
THIIKGMDDDELIALFQAIGLKEQRARDTAKNKKLALALQNTISEAGFTRNGCDKSIGDLLYTLASTVSKDASAHLGYLARAISDNRLTSSDQVAAAIKFAETANEEINDEEFNQACGVDQITAAIASHLEANKDALISERYKLLGPLLAQARQIPELRWANGVAVKNELEKQVIAIIGPKDERDVTVKGK